MHRQRGIARCVFACRRGYKHTRGPVLPFGLTERRSPRPAEQFRPAKETAVSNVYMQLDTTSILLERRVLWPSKSTEAHQSVSKLQAHPLFAFYSRANEQRPKNEPWDCFDFQALHARPPGLEGIFEECKEKTMHRKFFFRSIAVLAASVATILAIAAFRSLSQIGNAQATEAQGETQGTLQVVDSSGTPKAICPLQTH